MANVTPKNHISVSSTSTAVTVNAAPAATVPGDYLVAEVTVAGATALTSAPNSSWSLIHAAPAGAGLYHAIWAKFATSSTDGTGTWTANSASSVSVTITGYSNVDNTTPVRIHTSTTTTNAISIIPANATGLTVTDQVIISSATTAGPRPWPDAGTGCQFGAQPNSSFGDWVAQSGVATLEATINRPLAHGHSFAPWDMSSFPTGSPATTGPNCDLAHNRMSFISWFSDRSYPPSGSGYTNATNPVTLLTDFKNGRWDSIILGNAQAMRTFKHPLIFRLFCEMNGGDHPYEIAYSQSGTAINHATWLAEFIPAWKRIWAITKGSDADIASFAPGYALNSGHSAGAQNVYFHFCPQTFESTTTSRDAMYPGDKFVDIGGSELYTKASTTDTASNAITDTSSGSANHAAADAYFSPGVTAGVNGATGSAGGKPVGNGEGGPRIFSGDTDTTSTKRIASFLTAIKNHIGWGVMSWWEGGSTANSNNSNIESYDAAQKTAVRSFVNDPYMKPLFDRTFATAAAWSELYQYRARLGGNDTNYGAGMSGTQTITKAATATSVTAPTISGYGYGDASAITFALVASGTTGNVAPFGGTVAIDNTTPNFDGVHTVVLTATPSGWSGNPAIISGDYSYQWKRGVTNVGTNSNQYTIVAGDVGNAISVVLTVNNGVSPNGTATAATAVVTNTSVPVNTAPPTVPASPVEFVLQTATQGTWTGALAFSYQWQQVTSSGTTNIAGATTLTYTPQPSDVGARLAIAVTAWTNANLTGTSTTVVSSTSNVVVTPGAVYPSYLKYPTFSGLASVVNNSYTSFNGVVDTTSAGNTEENRAARACVRVGNTDYWGGSFTLATSPGGTQVSQTNLAAVNATTGALLAFSPVLDGPVRGLAVSPDSQFLYAVGDFNHVNGSVRNGAAKFKISDGSLDASWAPSANGSVRGVTVSPNNATVYLSGNFTAINASNRRFVAAVDNVTGALLANFQPAFSDSLGNNLAEVRKIMFAPHDAVHVYCCGYFDTISANSVLSTRLALAQLNVSDGSVTSWHPDLTGNTGTTIGHDMDFLSDGTAIFIACAGSDVGGDGNTFLRYNLTPASNTRVWANVLDGDVNSIATNDTYVWAGTHGDGTQNVSTIANVGTRKVCCVRASNGTDTVSGGQKHSLWTPNSQFDGIKGTYTIVVADNALLLGGGWANPNQAAASFPATVATLSEFTMQVDTLSGVTVTPGASVQVAIDFSPAVVGPRTATMTITDNASGSPRSIILNGTGVTSAPIITTTPASTVAFGQVPLVNRSTTATFTFTDSTSGATFLGNLDNTAFVAVTSPMTYSNLSVGTHTFFLKAHNAAGDSPVATYTWTISP